MPYVDGFVLPVPKKNLQAYIRMAKLGEKIWRKHGALDYKECVDDDLRPKWGALFPRMTKLKPGETVAFSYIVFKSRAHRDVDITRWTENTVPSTGQVTSSSMGIVAPPAATNPPRTRTATIPLFNRWTKPAFMGSCL